MATPVVSGAVALLLQQNGNLTPDQIKARLMKTAYKTFPASSVATDSATGQTYTSYYDMFTVGAGYLDVNAGLQNTDLAPANMGAALSPAAVYDPASGKVSLVSGNSAVSASSVVWGSSTGDSGPAGSSVVWGSSTALNQASAIDGKGDQ